MEKKRAGWCAPTPSLPRLNTSDSTNTPVQGWMATTHTIRHNTNHQIQSQSPLFSQVQWASPLSSFHIFTSPSFLSSSSSIVFCPLLSHSLQFLLFRVHIPFIRSNCSLPTFINYSLTHKTRTRAKQHHVYSLVRHAAMGWPDVMSRELATNTTVNQIQ